MTAAGTKAKKALIVSGQGFEDCELLVPYYRLLEAGITSQIAASQGGTLAGGKHGYTVAAVALAAIREEEFFLLILPGGKPPASLCRNEKLLALVRRFVAEGKTVAAICHGPLILAAAGVLVGKRATCYHRVAAELQRGGALYLDQELVVDGGVITARMPRDLPAFMRQIMDQRLRA
ncbi:MAG: DJ-1/PfpI/YhbO family deglycase/protease [Thermodesulfobacteriota bacterium]